MSNSHVETIKYLINEDFLYIYNYKSFSKHNIWGYYLFLVLYQIPTIIKKETLSNEETPESVTCSWQWEGNRLSWVCSNTFKHIPLSLICCHRKWNVDQKFTLTKLRDILGSDRHNWILNIKCSFSGTGNFRWYATTDCYPHEMLLQALYDHVLPSPEAKVN